MLREIDSHPKLLSGPRFGGHPIAITAAALVIIVVGVGGILLWRTSNGIIPEQERVTTARISQARVAQASEQLVEKTKGIEVSQQQSIDQLQVVQDQLQVVQQMLTAQRTETKRLNEQVAGLTTALDTLRQSFASIPPQTEAAEPPAVRKRSAVKSRPAKRARVAQRKRSK